MHTQTALKDSPWSTDIYMYSFQILTSVTLLTVTTQIHESVSPHTVNHRGHAYNALITE